MAGEELQRAIEIAHVNAAILVSESQFIQRVLPLHRERADDRAGRTADGGKRGGDIVGMDIQFGAGVRNVSGQRRDLGNVAGEMADQINAMAPAGIVDRRRDVRDPAKAGARLNGGLGARVCSKKR